MELLAGLPAEDVRRVLSRCRRRRFARGEVLFHEGDPADALHLVAVGRVAIRVTTALGETATIDITTPGDVVGEQALIPPTAPRGATAVALEPTETLALTSRDFAELRAAHPSVDDVLLGVMVRRHRAVTGRLVEALYVKAEVRVLRRLLDVAATYPAGPHGEVVVALTQEDLAGLAGTTRESVNRVLRKEVELGSLELSRGKVTLLDRRAVARRAR